MNNQTPLRIVFMGSPAAALPSLEALIESPHEVVGVVTRPDRPAGRGRHLQPCAVAKRARELGLPLWQPEKLSDPPLADKLKALETDLAIVVAYGKILSTDILEAPRNNCWNVHFSLLPKYRGASPVQAALLAGDTVTGVSIIELVRELDAGPVLAQAELPIPKTGNAAELEAALANSGAQLLIKTLNQLQEGSIRKQAQDDQRASFAPQLHKADGHLNWSQDARSIANRIRALNPWPGTFAYLPRGMAASSIPRGDVDKVQLKIYSAQALEGPAQGVPGQVEASSPEELVIACGTNRLKVLEVQMEGKKRMPVSDFLRGHTLNVGTQLL